MRIWILAVLILACAAGGARVHDDIVPYALGGKLLTGGHDDTTGANTATERVFGYDFGEDPLDPNIIGDPGFNNGSFAVGVFPGNGLLPAGFTLGMQVLTNLSYWDGAGAVSFESAPDDVLLGLNRGSSTVLISALGTSGSVPTIGGTGTGRLHVHLQSQLHFTDGTGPLPPNAPDGAYLVGLRLTLPGSGVADSEPIYLVYNNNLDEELHDEAIDWVRGHLVPEPSSWVLMLMAGIGIVTAKLSRKRRWRRG